VEQLMTNPTGRVPRMPRPRPASGGGVFAAVLDGRPYPTPQLTGRDWAGIPPRQVRLCDLTTTKTELRLDVLLAEDSTFYGDLFCHVIEWEGALYLEDGLHRAVHAALRQRDVLHVRVARIDTEGRLI
jgi:Arc/MetJ family transcription regulator